MENWPYLGNGERYKSPIRSGVYMPCQIKWKSLTLDDLEGQWQPVRSANLATAGLLVYVRQTMIRLRFGGLHRSTLLILT